MGYMDCSEIKRYVCEKIEKKIYTCLQNLTKHYEWFPLQVGLINHLFIVQVFSHPRVNNHSHSAKFLSQYVRAPAGCRNVRIGIPIKVNFLFIYSFYFSLRQSFSRKAICCQDESEETTSPKAQASRQARNRLGKILFRLPSFLSKLYAICPRGEAMPCDSLLCALPTSCKKNSGKRECQSSVVGSLR